MLSIFRQSPQTPLHPIEPGYIKLYIERGGKPRNPHSWGIAYLTLAAQPNTEAWATGKLQIWHTDHSDWGELSHLSVRLIALTEDPYDYVMIAPYEHSGPLGHALIDWLWPYMGDSSIDLARVRRDLQAGTMSPLPVMVRLVWREPFALYANAPANYLVNAPPELLFGSEYGAPKGGWKPSGHYHVTYALAPDDAPAAPASS